MRLGFSGAIAACVGAYFLIAAAAASARCLPIVAVYPSWKTSSLAPADIPWERFTHLAVVFALPEADGGLRTREVDALLPGLVSDAHTRGRKVYLSIGGAQGFGDAFQQLARDPAKRQRFVGLVRDYAARQRLDGIDIDWEHWTRQHRLHQGGNDPEESALLVRLLADLRAALPASVDLTASVFAGRWIGDQYLSEIQQHVNYVALMSYDFTGAWPSSTVGHHADFATFKASTQYLLGRGFKRDKILIGLPFYGKEFVDARKEQVRDHAFVDILARVEGEGADSAHIGSGRSGHIYYETPDLIRQKSQYVLEQGFAGLMMFELSMDALHSPHSLSKAINSVLSPARCLKPL